MAYTYKNKWILISYILSQKINKGGGVYRNKYYTILILFYNIIIVFAFWHLIYNSSYSLREKVNVNTIYKQCKCNFGIYDTILTMCLHEKVHVKHDINDV